MITAVEEALIEGHAYVPEHLPAYVAAISGSEAYLVGDYLCYRGEDSIVFIGYPLRSPFTEAAMGEALARALARFRPGSVAVTAPATSTLGGARGRRESDRYYRLDLSGLRLGGKVRNMIRRASGAVRVERTGQMEAEHLRLTAEFLASHQVSEGTRFIFERIPAYVASVPTARVFSARDARGELVAFDVAEFGARDYAFYQFNFRSSSRSVPGASDLLLHEVIQNAREEGKRFVNLGLGINPGVTRFKVKWGGVPFLDYECFRYRLSRPEGFGTLLRKL